ncbi:putative Transcriptional-regulating factor 1 [Hypsibius exemplaris]|uniref:Transcriptional-regulating factor 1 n=1 Tax=Hypsibius exemplaris TaxID=2072580 RepID=A0A1W0WSG7_HYPEX|nr:putative Transcriptional-regulating factor 1 [Hypsibius exemplaris]
MQNPPAYVQVDAAGQTSRQPTFQYSPLYARVGGSPSRSSLENINNDLASGLPNIILGHHPSASHHHYSSHGSGSGGSVLPYASEINASRLQQLHNRLANSPYGTVSSSTSPIPGRKSQSNSSSSSNLNGLVPGLPSFPSSHHHVHHSGGHHQSGSSRSPFDGPASLHHHHHHGALSTSHPNLNEAFVNSFGLSSSAFLNPYFADRTRSPSPLHRFLHSQLLGGQYGHGGSGGGGSGNDGHHLFHDDLLLDSGPFRGLNLSTNFGSTLLDEQQQQHGGHSRHHSGTDPLITSGHLSRSLDDLSVVLDNSNESADLRRHHDDSSSSPDESLRNDFTHSSSQPATTSTAENGHPTALVRSVSAAASTSSSQNHHQQQHSHHSGHHNQQQQHAGKVSNSNKTARRLTTTRADISRTCPTCGKTFGNSSGLAKHRLTHSDERKYLCTICMKSFKRQDHLSGHLLTHSDKKPFACPVDNCGKSYCDSRSLKRHLDQHESWMIPDTVRLMFSEGNAADDTDDTLSVLDNQEVQNFSRNADQLRPFPCQICKRRFKNGPALNGHMRLHGGFFNKKTGDYTATPDFSAPPSVQSSLNVDYSAVQSPSEMMDHHDQQDARRNRLDSFDQSDGGGADWNDTSDMPSPVPSSYSHHNDNSSLNHVAVICHVPPGHANSNSLKGPITLPPVSTLASPTNSPTSLNSTFQFTYPGQHSPPLSAPQSVAPPRQQQSLSIPAASAKSRRHSDSDNVVPAKRPCTVTDMLRRTITTNMARKIGSGSPVDDCGTVGGMGGFPHGSMMQHEDSSTRASEMSGHFDHTGEDDSVFQTNPFSGNVEITSRSRHPSQQSFEEQTKMSNPQHSPISDFRSIDSPASVVGSLTSGSDQDYPDSPFGTGSNSDITAPHTGSKKMKRKHRPEPLIIPPHNTSNNGMNGPPPLLSPNSIGFSSRLRSPRIIGLTTGEGGNGTSNKNGCTPPPYTPPPMLSPSRRGSGLFWNVIVSTGNVGNSSVAAATPQSGSRFLLKRSLSNSSTGLLDFRNSGIGSGRIAEDVDMLLLNESPFNFSQPAPETDSTPHINVGDGHQADLPAFNPHADEIYCSPICEEPLWNPKVVSGLSDFDLEQFAGFAESGPLPKGGQNVELAYHVLFHSAGDLLRATKVLLRKDELPTFLQRHPALRTYHYQNSDIWSPEEIGMFSAALAKHDKDFFLVAGDIKSKSVKQCVEFYYHWKKLLPDERKRMKLARTKRQAELVTRSKTAQLAQKTDLVEPPAKVSKTTESGPPFICPFAGCGNPFGTKQALSAHSRVHLSARSNGNGNGNRVPASLDMCPPPVPVMSMPDPLPVNRSGSSEIHSQFPFTALNVEPAASAATTFPCRICDKVFQGVKSRNAHMKVHSASSASNQMDRV